ncbi:hypothetical protein HDE68_002317 [Pedobacter cryoconitis]|uniref:Uncharacterized protein n=1 Tax=Pedobacter cryoconitis TaxID=188932 RepID=A0A7W8ZLW7_9SPHI|nr:hypothetical protein [Pedobacter cryoconitis]MBB5636416.1 hypothetical protein [Pedobacter cryoconitis]
MALFITIKDYLFHQAYLHQVNPWLFGVLYLLSKILFLTFIGQAIKKLRKKKSVLLPLLFAALGYSLPYLYLIIAGKNIPVWIYLVISVIYVFSGWSIRAKLQNAQLKSASDHALISGAEEADS